MVNPEALLVSDASDSVGRKLPFAGELRPVPLAFWAASGAVWLLLLIGLPHNQIWVQQAGLIFMLIGGLPHGGHDMLLAYSRWKMGAAALVGFVLAYLLVAGAMAAVWQFAPVAALALFLGYSSLHFSQDWAEPREPLLRMACGMAPIAAAALGNADEVRALFTAMAGPEGAVFQSLLMMIAPVTLLVASAGLLTAWQSGERAWALGQGVAIAQLVLLPPLVAFPIYYGFLHSHRHMVAIAREVPRLNGAAVLLAAALSAAAAALWWALEPQFLTLSNGVSPALAFQLLSVVALPHLLFDHLQQRRAGH